MIGDLPGAGLLPLHVDGEHVPVGVHVVARHGQHDVLPGADAEGVVVRGGRTVLLVALRGDVLDRGGEGLLLLLLRLVGLELLIDDPVVDQLHRVHDLPGQTELLVVEDHEVVVLPQGQVGAGVGLGDHLLDGLLPLAGAHVAERTAPGPVGAAPGLRGRHDLGAGAAGAELLRLAAVERDPEQGVGGGEHDVVRLGTSLLDLPQLERGDAVLLQRVVLHLGAEPQHADRKSVV